MAGLLRVNHCCIKMDAPHGFDGKRWPSKLAFWHAGGNRRDKITPRNNNAFHLAQELALARAFARRPLSQTLLLQADVVSADAAADKQRLSRLMQTFLNSLQEELQSDPPQI